MQEKLIEAEGVRYAKKLGWLVYKFGTPGSTGIHDRIHFKNGLCFTIEYKSTGKKATPKQRGHAEKLSAAGIPCRCVDTVEKARRFIYVMDRLAFLIAPAERFKKHALYALAISSFDP